MYTSAEILSTSQQSCVLPHQMWQWLISDLVHDTTAERSTALRLRDSTSCTLGWSRTLFWSPSSLYSGSRAVLTGQAESSVWHLTAQSSVRSIPISSCTDPVHPWPCLVQPSTGWGIWPERCFWKQRQLQWLLGFFQLNPVRSHGEAVNLQFLWKCTGWRSYHTFASWCYLFKGITVPFF